MDKGAGFFKNIKPQDKMIIINIKPLSVNAAWTGSRFKTDAYKKYERDVLLLLPRMDLPAPPYKITIQYGFSSKGSDIDNPTKMILDILQKKYLFNDSQIYDLHLLKNIVEKGREYVKINIETLINK